MEEPKCLLDCRTKEEEEENLFNRVRTVIIVLLTSSTINAYVCQNYCILVNHIEVVEL